MMAKEQRTTGGDDDDFTVESGGDILVLCSHDDIKISKLSK
jgi:hypothetical protein